MRYDNLFESTLYVWDYFYCANTPPPGDEKAWRAIENATGRLREWMQYLVTDQSKLFHPVTREETIEIAKRCRRAIRAALRNIERLSVEVETWVIDELGGLERHAEQYLDPTPELLAAPPLN